MPAELDLGPSARAFRDEVRGWLEANRPEELAGVGGRNEPDRWQRTFVGTRSVTIWGGTAQVQRNIVGERVLGLPKDPPPGGAR
jgi:hypothetical protein